VSGSSGTPRVSPPATPSPGGFDDPAALLAAIVECSDDAIVAETLDGTIISWNAGAERLYGYRAPEIVGQNISIIVPGDRGSELDAILVRLRGGECIEHLETKRVCKDGALVEVSMSISPIRNRAGAIVGASMVARDLTERNTAREALAESERRALAARSQAETDESVSRAKSEVVSLVSHELRSPLASIVGFTELLFTRDLSEAQRKVYLGVMLREARRLTELVNGVLHLQRLEEGHEVLNLAPVDIRALVQRAVEAAGEDDRRPIGMILPEPLPLVMVDPDAVLQVLGNFLSNARKFSPTGGSIRIGARVVDDMVQVYVRDEGLGLPPEALPKLFQKFYRIDSPDRRLIRGTGLGLSINQKIIEGHGGKVEAHSDGLGKGTRFTFTLPLARDAAKRGDILIVEDDASFARMLEAEFANRGLTSVWASDAETAEHLMRASPQPRALVVDLKLPGLQGEDFIARLRAEQGNDVPIVVVTVKNLSMAEIASLQRTGVTAVLPKEAGAPQAAASVIAEALSSTPVAS
jgi:PAS domain S-box-containing protein